MKLVALIGLLLTACATTIAVNDPPKQPAAIPSPVTVSKPKIKLPVIDCRDYTPYDSSHAKMLARQYQKDLKFYKEGRNDWLSGGNDAQIFRLTQELDRLDSITRCHPDQ